MTNPITDESKTVHRLATGEFFPTLDGVRALAILSVVIHHTFYFNPASPIGQVAYTLIRPGWMGVPIFFVLSGFLISYSVFKAGGNFEWRTYAVRRVAKILPPFYLSILVYGAIISLIHGPKGMLTAMLADATTAAGFLSFPNLADVYWTLYIEIYFYVIFPIVYVIARKLTRSPEEATFLFFLFVPLGAKLWYQHVSFEFPTTLDNFVLGIFFAILVNKRSSATFLSQWAPVLVSLGASLLICSYLGYAILEYKYHIITIPYEIRFELLRYLPELATFMLLFSIYLPAKHFIVQLLTWTPLVFIGLVSYEWYLFHQLQVIPDEYIGHSRGRLGIYMVKTVFIPLLTLAMASGVYYSFSAPILHWAKRKVSGRVKRLCSST